MAEGRSTHTIYVSKHVSVVRLSTPVLVMVNRSAWSLASVVGLATALR